MALWLQPTNTEKKQTQGAGLTAIAVQCSIVSVMQRKGQQLGVSSAIPYFHEPHPGFAKTILRHKGVPCVLSGFGLNAQTVWNVVGTMSVSHSPDWDHPFISHSEESSCQTVTAFIHRPFPFICTLLSFLPLISCAAYLLLDVQSSFCTWIWSRLSIRNQYFKWCFPHKIIIIVKSKYFADLESSKNILCMSWQETIIKLSSNCFYCGKVRMLDYMCQHVKIKTV